MMKPVCSLSQRGGEGTFIHVLGETPTAKRYIDSKNGYTTGCVTDSISQITCFSKTTVATQLCQAVFVVLELFHILCVATETHLKMPCERDPHTPIRSPLFC